MKILITGGAGYIGSHAVKLFLEKGHQVVVLDNLSHGYREVIDVLSQKFPKKLSFHKADLRDKEAVAKVFTKEKPKAVLHFAALCLVTESMEKPAEYFENNILGTLNLLRVMQEKKVSYLVFSSTCAVYGESQYLPVDEKHPTQSVNPYGASKLAAENMISWFGKIHQLKFAILRYFNVAGAASDGLIGDSKKPSVLLVQNAVRGALKIAPFKLTCPKVNTPDKSPIRDYINIEDLADAHAAALDYLLKGGQNNIFNLGTGQGNSVLEIVKEIKKITGIDFPVSQGTTRKGEYAKVYASIRKAKRLLCWQPQRTIKDSVASNIDWYKKRPQGWNY